VSDAEAGNDAMSAGRQLSSKRDADPMRLRAVQDADAVSSEHRGRQLPSERDADAMPVKSGRHTVHATTVPRRNGQADSVPRSS